MEITPIRKRETELNPRRGSARLRANRFAPLQTVDRPKPGKLRDQDGRQAGCVRKHVLPSRFLIGLSRASDETRRKGLLNPSNPQLLRGRLAWRGRLVGRGRLARHPPRRRPSELAPLGTATGGASPPGEPSRIAPRTWGRLPPQPGRPTKGPQDPRTTVSRPSILRRPGRDLLSYCRFVLSSTGRRRGAASPAFRPPGLLTRSPRRTCGGTVPAGPPSPAAAEQRETDDNCRTTIMTIPQPFIKSERNQNE